MSLAKILETEIEIKGFLESRFGVTKSELMDVVRKAALAYDSGTEYHPAIYAGTSAWSEMVRSLRALLIPKGWQKVHESGLDKTINNELGLSIICTSGNAAVGKKDAPLLLTKNEKGNAVERLLQQNRFHMDDLFEDDFMSSPLDEGSTWILIHHFDTRANEMRAELALPISRNEKERINDWKFRVFLGSVSLDNLKTSTLSAPEFSEAIEIPVISKKNE